MSNFVLVLDTYKKPLDPCHPAVARKLLKNGKAAVFRWFPFIIILKRAVTSPITQAYQAKLDPGSKTTGIALVRSDDAVVWAAELHHRGGLIKEKKLPARAAYRRLRRQRLRYRPARFLNRTKPKGWLAPSLMHRVHTVMTWVKRLLRYVPIDRLAQELVRFDAQKMQDAEITGVEYQQGELAGYEVREYLLAKWGRQCAYCAKAKVALEIEHLTPTSRGGSNRVSNLTLACHTCNQNKGNRTAEEFGYPHLQALAKQPLKDAAAVNATRWTLFEALNETALPVEVGSGSRTKCNRTRLGLAKAHWLDAACVGTVEYLTLLTTKPLHSVCKGHGGRQKAVLNKHGRAKQYRPLKPIYGWRSGDIARFGKLIVRVTPRQKGRFALSPLKGGKPFNGTPTQLVRVHQCDGYVYH